MGDPSGEPPVYVRRPPYRLELQIKARNAIDIAHQDLDSHPVTRSRLLIDQIIADASPPRGIGRIARQGKFDLIEAGAMDLEGTDSLKHCLNLALKKIDLSQKPPP